MSEGTLSFADLLQHEGVLCKGFGVLPKFVMIDSDLTVEAKAIYAYLCSLAGNGTTAFPSREAIIYNLGVNRDTYYKHFNILLAHGYITREQQRTNGADFGTNKYTIVSNPKKFQEASPTQSQSKAYSRIRFSGIKSAGYGIVPRLVMIDERLPIKAKGLYAYFCSFTGSGNNAFPLLDTILHHLSLSKTTYYKFYNQLIELNYITVVQRNIQGKFSINDYYLNDNPNLEQTVPGTPSSRFSDTQYDVADASSEIQNTSSAPFPNSSDTQISDTLPLPFPNSSDTQKPDTQKPDTQISDTTINSITKNNLTKNNPSIHQQATDEQLGSSHVDGGIERRPSSKEVENEIRAAHGLPSRYAQDVDCAEAAIRFIFDWERFSTGYEDEFRQDVYLLFVNALIKMITTTVPMKLKGEFVSNVRVMEKVNEALVIAPGYISLWPLGEQAMNDYITGSQNTNIKNHLQYMKACIWNAFFTYRINESSESNAFSQRMSDDV